MSANAKNFTIRCASQEKLFQLKDEYENYVGRDTTYDLGTLTLTILALPKKYKRKTTRESKLRRARQNRESFSDYEDYEDYSDYEG
ncbi:MAG: hypothetical protein H9W81_17345 [Enterococcus sp.]|nr:hypothetical protein [Enterococcus sp.]